MLGDVAPDEGQPDVLEADQRADERALRDPPLVHRGRLERDARHAEHRLLRARGGLRVRELERRGQLDVLRLRVGLVLEQDDARRLDDGGHVHELRRRAGEEPPERRGTPRPLLRDDRRPRLLVDGVEELALARLLGAALLLALLRGGIGGGADDALLGVLLLLPLLLLLLLALLLLLVLLLPSPPLLLLLLFLLLLLLLLLALLLLLLRLVLERRVGEHAEALCRVRELLLALQLDVPVVDEVLAEADRLAALQPVRVAEEVDELDRLEALHLRERAALLGLDPVPHDLERRLEVELALELLKVELLRGRLALRGTLDERELRLQLPEVRRLLLHELRPERREVGEQRREEEHLRARDACADHERPGARVHQRRDAEEALLARRRVQQALVQRRRVRAEVGDDDLVDPERHVHELGVGDLDPGDRVVDLEDDELVALVPPVPLHDLERDGVDLHRRLDGDAPSKRHLLRDRLLRRCRSECSGRRCRSRCRCRCRCRCR